MIKIGKSVANISVYTYQPKDKKELIEIIDDRIEQEGPNCDLNDIDTSLITDMSHLFYKSRFNGNISRWDVSNVENIGWMFSWSKFNGDISKWKINKNCYNYHMFYNCPIKEEYKPLIFQNKI